MKRWLIRIIVILGLAQVGYLAIVNIVLNLPATQTLLNRLQPERFAVHWDFAWSWYPLAVEARGVSINGQSWSQQFEISAPSVSATLAIRALLEKTMQITDITTGDVSLRLRPRLRADHDDTALRQFYPTIAGRDPNAPADPMPVEKPGWKIVADVAHVGGRNDVWLAALRMTLAGEISTTVTIQNPHGLLAISNGNTDVSLEGLTVAGQQVSRRGLIKGGFDFLPFRPPQNRGFKILAFAALDINFDLPVEDLGFLDPLLSSVSGMSLGGRGGLSGRVVFDKGNLVPGTDLTIAADELRVDLPPYSARGVGAVVITVDPACPDTLDANVRFKTVSAFREPGHETLFTGTDIAINIARSSVILPGVDTEKLPRKVAIALSKVAVPDVSVYQRYLPDEWNAQLVGGRGSLDGAASMSAADLDVDLTLRSEDAEVRFTENTFQSGMALGVKAKGTTGATKAHVDVSGTYFELHDSRVTSKKGASSSPWQTRFVISSGTADLALPEGQDQKTGVVGFWSLFQAEELKSLLGTVDGRVNGSLSVSDLDWVTFLFRRPFSLAIKDAAELRADLTLKAGRLDAGSSLKMPPRQFTLGILDYVVEGSGGFDLMVTKGGVKPDLSIAASLTGASLRLDDEKTAVVESVVLSVTATAEAVSPKDGSAAKSVRMSIASAKVTDMTAYNAYLPRGSPVRILGGTADLTAELIIKENNASGFVKVSAPRFVVDLHGKRIAGSMALDVPIRSGSAKDKRFDISGASMSIDHVGAVGQNSPAGNWSGGIELTKARVVWKRPMTLDITAKVRMSDARPLLAVFEDSRKANKWLDRLSDLKNIRASATINIEPGKVEIPYAFVKSEKISVGAKGTIREDDSEGMLYARYGKLAGILAFDNGQKRFKAFSATKIFDDYVLGGPLPAMRDAPRGTPGQRRRNPRSQSSKLDKARWLRCFNDPKYVCTRWNPHGTGRVRWNFDSFRLRSRVGCYVLPRFPNVRAISAPDRFGKPSPPAARKLQAASG
jgi:hypothetical protein